MSRIDQMLAEIDDRFTHHPPRTPQEIEHHEMIRAEFKGIALELCRNLPEKVTTSREFALTLTHLEIASYECHAAYARHKPEEVEVDE